MELFHIDLNEMAHRRSRLYKACSTGALVLIVLSVATVVLLDDTAKGTRLSLIVPIVYTILYIYYVWFASQTKLYIQANEHAVRFSLGMVRHTSQTIMWGTVGKVRLGPTYVAFYKHTGKRKVFRLGWLPYAKVVEVKEQVGRACEFKGIACERSEVRRSDKK